MENPKTPTPSQEACPASEGSRSRLPAFQPSLYDYSSPLPTGLRLYAPPASHHPVRPLPDNQSRGGQRVTCKEQPIGGRGGRQGWSGPAGGTPFSVTWFPGGLHPQSWGRRFTTNSEQFSPALGPQDGCCYPGWFRRCLISHLGKGFGGCCAPGFRFREERLTDPTLFIALVRTAA